MANSYFPSPIWTLTAIAVIFQAVVFSTSSPTTGSPTAPSATPAGRVDTVGGKSKCFATVDEETSMKWKNATLKCVAGTTERPDTSFLLKWNASLEEVDYDDKCMSKCVYEELNILTSDIKPKKDQIDFFKGNLTEGMKTKINSIWNNCVDDAERISKDKNFPSDNCKLVALHNICMFRQFVGERVFQDCD